MSLDYDQPISNDDWRARDDATTLARAEKIKSDPGRLEKARLQAAKLLEEEKRDISNLRKVAGGKMKDPVQKDTPSFNVFEKINKKNRR